MAEKKTVVIKESNDHATQEGTAAATSGEATTTEAPAASASAAAAGSSRRMSVTPRDGKGVSIKLINVQGASSVRGPGLGLGFGMFHRPAWAVGSYSSSPPARGTPQIKFNPTQVRDQMRHPVHL